MFDQMYQQCLLEKHLVCGKSNSLSYVCRSKNWDHQKFEFDSTLDSYVILLLNDHLTRTLEKHI